MARYLTIEDGREYLWDFDENRILLVTYGDTENIRQVEFSTDDTEGPTTWTSEVMTNPTTGNKYVQVPNEFLNGEYSRLVCYVIAEDETGQHTRTKEIFRIKKRQQPEDYEITFTDRVYIRDLKAIAERYRDQAKSYSESAAASSTQAGQHNAGALASKNAAEQSAQQANQSMTLSKQYSENSAESASQSAATFNSLKEYVGSESNPSSALGQIYTAKENAKQEVTEHAESTKAGVIDPYVENTTKPAIDAFTEAQKKELDTYEKSKESELDTYNESQKAELNTHTASMKSQIDGYTTAKEQDISEFTEQKKSEVQGVYQNDFNELKGDLNNLHNEKTFYINSSATSTWVEFEVHAGVKYRIYNNTITDSSFLIRTVDAKGSGNIIDNFGSIIRGNYIEIIPTQDAKYWWITLGVKDTTNIVKFEDMSKRITQIEDNISKINKEITFNNIITVKKDGKGDFTTIRGAVDSIKDASADNPYTIEVYEGVYNVLEDYTDEEIRQSNVPTSGFDNNTFVGVKLTDGISIRGIGARDKIILNGELDPAIWDFKYRRNISTLNLDGDCNVENLTIVGSQLRYCIHDDFSKNKKNSFNRKVINVILKPISVTSGIAYGGGGAGGAMYGIFENCDFGNTFAFHSNPNKSDSDITLVNCKGAKISLDDMGSNCYVKLQNCSFDYICLNDITSDHIQKMFLYGCGNDESIVVAPSNYVYETGNISKVYPSGKFTVGNVVRKNLPIYSHEFELTNNHKLACGVIVFKNTDYVYIQTSGGFTSNTIQSLLGGSLGDYITVNENNELTYSNANADNAIAIVTSVDTDNVVYARLLM